jgi:hypothetical protein
MEITSLWLTRVVLCASVLTMGSAHAKEARCPPYHARSPLSGAVVFDGPPNERADLMPDQSRRSDDHAHAAWNVGYIFEMGRKLFLVCRYSNLSDTVTIKVDKKVRRCIYDATPNRPAELSCR